MAAEYRCNRCTNILFLIGDVCWNKTDLEGGYLSGIQSETVA